MRGLVLPRGHPNPREGSVKVWGLRGSDERSGVYKRNWVQRSGIEEETGLHIYIFGPLAQANIWSSVPKASPLSSNQPITRTGKMEKEDVSPFLHS